jgi:tetratricopeptide (TPR) repeat protein
MVGEALGRVDPDQQDVFEADVAVALAEAGQADQARERVAAIIARWPDHFWVKVNAGDALAELGDAAAAEVQYRAAVDIADAKNDLVGQSEAKQRIADLHGERPTRAAADWREPGPQARTPSPSRPAPKTQATEPGQAQAVAPQRRPGQYADCSRCLAAIARTPHSRRGPWSGSQNGNQLHLTGW